MVYTKKDLKELKQLKKEYPKQENVVDFIFYLNKLDKKNKNTTVKQK